MSAGRDSARRADRQVDRLYAAMRRVYGGHHARANGYRSVGFFRREQRVVLDALMDGRDNPGGFDGAAASDGQNGPVLDIACGSGLMLSDLPTGRDLGRAVVGVDFNARACADARANGLAVVRGDAFSLPFAPSGFAQAINCQFFNQQPAEARAPFMTEAARCIKPGGRLILLWRKADSRLHVTAHMILSVLDRLRGMPVFPQTLHSVEGMADAGRAAGFRVVGIGTTLPIAIGHGAHARIVPAWSWMARLVGASNLLVLEKPLGEADP